MRFQEAFWNYQMESTNGHVLKSRLKLFFGLFLLMNVWSYYKRVEFYMEHSFDILNPDIEYLVERY